MVPLLTSITEKNNAEVLSADKVWENGSNYLSLQKDRTSPHNVNKHYVATPW